MRFHLTQSAAVCSCLFMAAGYVGVLYTLPYSIRKLPRDHPTHILARFLLICIMSALCPFLLATFYDENDTDMSFASWLGIRSDSLFEAFMLPLLLTSILFMGSLLSNGLRLYIASKQFYQDGLWYALKNSTLYYAITHEQLQSARTYIMGPLTEEFVFRSCMIPLLVCARFSVKQIIIGSPLTFGVAHVHHFVEHIRNGRRMMEAFLIVAFQFLYTSLFGAYATFLYLRTGHFMSVYIVHVFCNVMGFPDLSFFIPGNTLHRFRIAILGAHFLGIYGFSRCLMPFTEPMLYDAEMWNRTIVT